MIESSMHHDAHVTTWTKHYAILFSQKAIAKGFKPKALHKYTDTDGSPLYWRIRLKHSDSGEKWIRPMKRDGSAFTLGEPSFPHGKKPLYRLHKLIATLSATVWVVEGERCADELEKLGALTTTSGSVDSAENTDWQPLAGRTVTIWPDNDEAGKRYEKAIIKILLGLGCTIRVVNVAALDLPPKGDAVDWLEAKVSATLDDINNLPMISAKFSSDETTPHNSRYPIDVHLLRGSDLTPEAVAWLWIGWLAAGKLSILGGAPGMAKTTIAMILASSATTGKNWPDGSTSLAGNVVIWSGEDDPKDTLIPRLLLAGADLSRVFFIADVFDAGEKRPFDPAKDMDVLRRKLTEVADVRLLIIDPIVSAIAGDSHKNAEVRRGLQPLVNLAAAMRCAVLGITHFSKGTGGRDPVERLTGSLAFGALARVVLVAAKMQEKGDDGGTVRLLLRAKSNIGPDDGGFKFELFQAELENHPGIYAASLLWGDPVSGAAHEMLATAGTAGDDGLDGTLADAQRFLADLLADGPLPTKTIMADADGAGYSWATIRRAQKTLRIEATKEGMRGGWIWRMPS